MKRGDRFFYDLSIKDA